MLAVEAWAVSTNLSILLFITSIFSFLHWNFFRYNSWLSLIDRFCASLVFIYVFVRGGGWVHYKLAFSAIIAFICGNSALLARDWDKHLCYHAIFRYCSFWMILSFCRQIEYYEIILFSCVYIGHQNCMTLWLIDELNHMSNGGYPKPANKKG